MTTELFLILLFFVAFLYASVGHGGASGYLALMAIYGISSTVTKPTALLLNLFVSLTSFIQFARGGFFRRQIFVPLVIASIPMSFIGGLLTLEEDPYKKVLGITLLVPAFRFLFFPNTQSHELRKSNPGLSLAIGAFIGFLSGLIGIGGGILLSPILLLYNNMCFHPLLLVHHILQQSTGFLNALVYGFKYASYNYVKEQLRSVRRTIHSICSSTSNDREQKDQGWEGIEMRQILLP